MPQHRPPTLKCIVEGNEIEDSDECLDTEKKTMEKAEEIRKLKSEMWGLDYDTSLQHEQLINELKELKKSYKSVCQREWPEDIRHREEMKVRKTKKKQNIKESKNIRDKKLLKNRMLRKQEKEEEEKNRILRKQKKEEEERERREALEREEAAEEAAEEAGGVSSVQFWMSLLGVRGSIAQQRASTVFNPFSLDGVGQGGGGKTKKKNKSLKRSKTKKRKTKKRKSRRKKKRRS